MATAKKSIKTATAATVPDTAPARVETPVATPKKKPVKAQKKSATTPKAPVKAVARAKAGVSAKPSKAPTAPKVVKPAKPEKPKKPKMVRDSFTIPKLEYAVLDELKQRAAKGGTAVKKSELLRAGIKALAAMDSANLLAALGAVPAIKTGRPAKS